MILRFTLEPADNTRLARVCGSLDAHLRDIEARLGVKLSRREAQFRVEGPKAAAERARSLLEALYERSRRPLAAETFELALVEAGADASDARSRRPEGGEGPLVLRTRRADLSARTPRQLQYLQQILAHDITFGLGPAGTGKTFLAVACAVDALERSSVQRIVLTRPAVEAGERLGFLPGDLTQKVDPYLRPLYDALYDLMGFDKVGKLFERQAIEIAPLAYMRGRTLNHAFIILDEAQNTTPEQMKMFLTRIGIGAKAVVTGDVTQVDLARGQKSGLIEARRILADVRGIAFTDFLAEDVVRHPLVARIVTAYEAHDKASH